MREQILTKKYRLPVIDNLDLLVVNSTNAHKKNSVDSWKLGETQIKKVLEYINLYKS